MSSVDPTSLHMCGGVFSSHVYYSWILICMSLLYFKSDCCQILPASDCCGKSALQVKKKSTKNHDMLFSCLTNRVFAANAMA